MQNSSLIVCIGNDLREDDGFAKELGLKIEDLKIASVMYCHQLMPEIAETIIKYEKVIFIDAKIGDNLGMLELIQINVQNATFSKFGHHQSPEFILSLTAALYGKIPQCFLLTMQTQNFDLKEGISKHASHALKQGVKMIQNLIRQEAN